MLTPYRTPLTPEAEREYYLECRVVVYYVEHLVKALDVSDSFCKANDVAESHVFHCLKGYIDNVADEGLARMAKVIEHGVTTGRGKLTLANIGSRLLGDYIVCRNDLAEKGEMTPLEKGLTPVETIEAILADPVHDIHEVSVEELKQ